MFFKPWSRKQPWQCFILPLVCLLAGGLVWTWAAPSAISGTPPSPAVGWAVGISSDSYGVILHTSDGGAHWLRQKTAAEVPDVNLEVVCAVDQVMPGLWGEILAATG
jgi:hypothetical protein